MSSWIYFTQIPSEMGRRRIKSLRKTESERMMYMMLFFLTRCSAISSLLSSFIPAVESEVTRIADLRVLGAATEILLHDFLDRIIEYRHRSFHSGLRIRICDGRHSTVLAGIVEVHPADLLSFASYAFMAGLYRVG